MSRTVRTGAGLAQIGPVTEAENTREVFGEGLGRQRPRGPLGSRGSWHGLGVEVLGEEHVGRAS